MTENLVAGIDDIVSAITYQLDAEYADMQTTHCLCGTPTRAGAQCVSCLSSELSTLTGCPVATGDVVGALRAAARAKDFARRQVDVLLQAAMMRRYRDDDRAKAQTTLREASK